MTLSKKTRCGGTARHTDKREVQVRHPKGRVMSNCKVFLDELVDAIRFEYYERTSTDDDSDDQMHAPLLLHAAVNL